MTYRKLSDLKKLDSNPRTIKKEDLDKLKQSIADNPDYFEARPLILSNRTGELVILAGNQRYEAAKIIGLSEVPTYLIEGLTEEKEREIIIRDNVSNGQWDWDILANEWDYDKLEEWGVDIAKQIDELEEDEEIELEQSVQVEPPKEYILIIADPNSDDWEEIKESLDLGVVRRGGYKKGSAFDAVGLERVIRWQDFKKRYVVK